MELENEYDVELGERKVLDSGSVKYPITVTCKDTEEVIVDTTYTVSKRQEENLESMVRRFAEKRAREYENDSGHDFSGASVKLG